MATRDNQGLQVVVILMVLMVVGLGVFTYVFYTADVKSRADAEAARSQLATNQAQSSQYLQERNKLKVLIGHTEETEMAEIEAKFAEDVATYIADEGGVEPDLQAVNYRKIPQELREKYAALEQQLAEARTRESALIRERDALEAEKNEKVAAAEAQRDNYAEQMRSHQAEYASARQGMQKLQQDTLEAKRGIENQVAQVSTTLNAQIEKTKEEAEKWQRLAEGYQTQKESMEPKISDSPDGRIVWSNPKDKVVWIDIGTADQLRPQMTFSVFEQGESNLAQAKNKGSIEVLRIHDKHQAEARMVEYDPGNPIMPGDTIFTPIWGRGRSEKFAMAGVIDLNGNGRDDSDEIRRVIETAGGQVVAYVGEGGKLEGQITPEVRYLILGNRPTDRSTDAELAAFTNMQQAARVNGVSSIRIDQFVDWAGYKGAEKLVRLRDYSRLEEIETEEERTQQGFQPRRPNPRSSAY